MLGVEAIWLLSVATAAATAADKSTAFSVCADTPRSAFDFGADLLDGSATNLSAFAGTVSIITNVARFTYQYRDFNALLDKHPSFQMLAFPCNQFKYEEPSTDAELLNVLKYVRPGGGFEPHANLTLFAKIDVNGKDEHPLFNFLKEVCPPTYPIIGDPKYRMYSPIGVSDLVWNFEKFLVDRSGKPRYRFHPAAWGVNGSFVEKYLIELIGEHGKASKPLAIDAKLTE